MFSDVDIYVIADDAGDISENNYKWKFKFGTESVQIFPDDKNF